jgi:hypothetical protein
MEFICHNLKRPSLPWVSFLCVQAWMRVLKVLKRGKGFYEWNDNEVETVKKVKRQDELRNLLRAWLDFRSGHDVIKEILS